MCDSFPTQDGDRVGSIIEGSDAAINVIPNYPPPPWGIQGAT